MTLSHKIRYSETWMGEDERNSEIFWENFISSGVLC